MSQEEIIGEIKVAVPRMQAICAPGGKRDREEREFMLHISSLLDGRGRFTDWAWWEPIRGIYLEALRITYNVAKKQAESEAELEVRGNLAEMRSRVRGERRHKSKRHANEYIRFLIRSTQHTRRVWSLESRVSELMAGLAMTWSQLDQETIEKAIKTLAKATIRIKKERT